MLPCHMQLAVHSCTGCPATLTIQLVTGAITHKPCCGPCVSVHSEIYRNLEESFFSCMYASQVRRSCRRWSHVALLCLREVYTHRLEFAFIPVTHQHIAVSLFLRFHVCVGSFQGKAQGPAGVGGACSDLPCLLHDMEDHLQ